MNRLAGLIVINCLIVAVASPAGQDASSDARVLTLQEAIRLTLQHAPEVSVATAEAARVTEVLRETRSLNLPQIVTGTGAAYNNGFPLSIEGAAPSIFQVGFTQSIFSKKNNNLIREAAESSKAGQLGPEATRNELAAKTALVYYDLCHATKLRSLWRDRVQAAVLEQGITESLLEAGKVRPVDVTIAKAATASTQQELLVADEQMKMAEVQLRDLTGISEGTRIQTVDPQITNETLDKPADSLYQQALETYPEVRQAEANLRAKEFHLEAERGEGRPHIDIVSQYALFSKTNNYQDFFTTFTRNNFIIGLAVEMPIFNGHRTSARVAQSRQEVAEARLRLQRVKSALKLNIEHSLSDLRIARGAADLAGLEVKVAQESLQLNETLLQAGRISPKDLELSRSQLREKQIAQLESQKILFQREIELLRVAGAVDSLY